MTPIKSQISDIIPPDETPIRQKSACGQPRDESQFLRRCQTCAASFAGLAPGKTGERGIRNDWKWYCSATCARGHIPDECLT